MSKKSLLVICTLVIGFGGLGIASFNGIGQNRPRTVEPPPLTRKQVLIVPSHNGGGTAVPDSRGPLIEAANQNVVLKTSVDWLFGGKQQHGWFLYTALIDKLIGTDKDP